MRGMIPYFERTYKSHILMNVLLPQLSIRDPQDQLQITTQDTDQALDFLQQFFKDRKEIGKAPKEELKGYLTALKGAVKERIKQKNEASGSVKRITSKVFP